MGVVPTLKLALRANNMSWQRYERSIDKQSLPYMFDELITEIEQCTRVVLSKVATHLTGWAAIGPCAVAVFGSLIYNLYIPQI